MPKASIQLSTSKAQAHPGPQSPQIRQVSMQQQQPQQQFFQQQQQQYPQGYQQQYQPQPQPYQQQQQVYQQPQPYQQPQAPQPYQAVQQSYQQPASPQPQSHQPQPQQQFQQSYQQPTHHQQPLSHQPQPQQQFQQSYQQPVHQHQPQSHQPQPQQQFQQSYQQPLHNQQPPSHQPQPQQQFQQSYQRPVHHQPQPKQPQQQQQFEEHDQVDSVPVNASPMPERGASPSSAHPPPHFVRPLGQSLTVSENEVVHLETQVEPAGDPSIQVEWMRDGRPIYAGSRFNTSYDRGYIVLDILSPMAEDSGHYSCVARSNSGMDQTNPISVTVLEEESVITSTQLPEQSMMQNINNLEDSWSRPRYHKEELETGSKAPASVSRPLRGPQRVGEANGAHFEARVSPPGDANLQVEWFKDGIPLNSSCRFNMIVDRGFVILDIASCIVEDSGAYFFVVKNQAGQAQSNVVQMTVVGTESVVTRSVLPDSTIASLNQLENPESQIGHEFSRDGLRYEEECEPDCPPAFVIRPSPVHADEGCPARFLVKVSGVPMPKVQWIINDGILGNSNQYHIYRDGAINYLEIRRCKDPGDSAVKVVAWNNNGQTEAETFLRVTPALDFRPGLKHVAPGSNFEKMNRLKKVECSAELASALKKPRGPTETFRNVERFSEHKARSNRAADAADAENLYTDVQSRLRPQERGLGGSAGYAAPPKGYDYCDI